MRSTRPVLFAALFGTALLGFACSDDAKPTPPPVAAVSQEITPHVFVGKIGTTGALIALVESEDTLVGYTCGVDDSFATHTGWYFGTRKGAGVALVNANNGLRVDGELAEGGGSGTLTLADGTQVPWTVEPARGEAGLYDYEDAANLVGFIRANDGAAAGNAAVRVGAAGPATGVGTGGSSPVRPVPTPPPPPPATPTPPPPTQTAPPNVSFDNGGTPRTVPTAPVTKANDRVVKRSGPVVVFLVHGMSDNIGTKTAKDVDELTNGECNARRDTPLYGRCEWGQDFLPGLFGVASGGATLYNMAGQDVSGDKILTDPRTRPLIDENVGKTMNGECVKDTNQDEKHDPEIAKHFIIGGAKDGSMPKLVKNAPPLLSAFVTWRDSTRGMVFSGRRVTRQIYAALRWYEEQFNVTPGVILVTQSFGGLASRFMLSRPDPAALTGLFNQENVKLCKEDLAKMDYVRDRTLFLTTLATPHEGSYLAELVDPIKQNLAKTLESLKNLTELTKLSTVINLMDALFRALVPDAPDLRQVFIDSIEAALPIFQTGALTDMRLATMEKFNLGILAPQNARRTGASPIIGAQKQLIPVYATLARSPGGVAFDTPKMGEAFATLQTQRPKVKGWIVSTTGADVGVREFIPHGYGDATIAPYAEHRAILDKRARLFDGSPFVQQLEDKFNGDIAAVLAAVSPWFRGYLGEGAPAVLAAIQGATTLNLPKLVVPLHTSTRWKIGFDGTTAEVPVPALVCEGARIPLDYDELARLLVDSYGKTDAVLAQITGGDLNAILTGLGVAIQNDNELAKGVAEWFVGKLQALGSLPDECNALPDNAFDVFSVGELANWKIGEGTGTIPVPVWIDTGEPVSDGEMDTDGAVHSASALGFTLGKKPFYFEHDRGDENKILGSWYRLHDNPVTEKYNHGLQYGQDVGLWVRDTLMKPEIGPVPAEKTFSVWVE